LAPRDKYDDIQKIIGTGNKAKTHTYSASNGASPSDDVLADDVDELVTDDVDDLVDTIGAQGIEVLDESGHPALPDMKFDLDADAGEDVQLDLTPGAMDTTTDPVRLYLREMGTVPLLTRQGEVEIAKRLESGQLRVLKAVSRSPIVIQEVMAIGDDLKRGIRSIKELVVFNEEEVTDDILDARTKETIRKIDAMIVHHKKSTTVRGEAGRGQPEEESQAIPQASLEHRT